MKTAIKFIILVITMALFVPLVGCNVEEEIGIPPIVNDDLYDNNTQIASVRSVKVISGRNEHTALEHWHHGFNTEFSFSGMSKSPEMVADQLSSFMFDDDFQIIIEGQLNGEPTYYFHKLIDGEWSKVLVVSNRERRERIFLTHGRPRGEWEEVRQVESFLDILKPGEYILEVGVWWGTRNAGSAYQNFFRFIK